ncbi:hypothetical protein QEJ31_08835 [Pigmentibacter sp. JX0631]|nr:hypothetical protein [Pigmentibacter sp. JX0631]WGL58639.1 hypothetical protein QEJ31_08835 [Pigmentibacter sp. JX0631]
MKSVSEKMIASLENNISISINGTPVFLSRPIFRPRPPIPICF